MNSKNVIKYILQSTLIVLRFYLSEYIYLMRHQNVIILKFLVADLDKVFTRKQYILLKKNIRISH